ncbi:MAG TPA: hypothetical protein VIN58_09860 [Roseateles sp.]
MFWAVSPLDGIRVSWAGSDVHSVWRDVDGDFGRDVLRGRCRGSR